jgi:hypothetical protein
MEMQKLTSGHLKLERFVGAWYGPEHMHPSHWDPVGFTAIGRNTGRLALRGFALINEYEQERDGQVTFTGHGVMTYDPANDIYQLTWFDCLGTAPEAFVGRFEEEVLTLTSRRGQVQSRLTYDFRTAGKWLGRMEMSDNGKTWRTMFEGVYTRD